MEEEFNQKCLDALNKFRQRPMSYESNLKKFIIFVERLAKSRESVRNMEQLIKDLPHMPKMEKFSRVAQIDELAKEELKKYSAKKGKYKQFQTVKTLNGVIGDGLSEGSVALVANENSSPEDLPNQILLDVDDSERVGYHSLVNKDYVEVGIASKYDEELDEYDYLIIFSVPGALTDRLDTNIDLSELKEAFDLYDYKKRGLINTHSIEQILRNLGWDENEEGLYNIMKELDEKKGKKVNFNTFAKFILEHVTVETNDDDYIRRIFNIYRDDPKNDTVSLHTMRECCNDLQCEKCLKYINEAFGEEEAGGDIILTFEEFRDFMYGKYGKKAMEPKKTTTVKKTTVTTTVKDTTSKQKPKIKVSKK